MKRSVVVVVEHFDGRLARVTRELLACARKIQRLAALDVVAVILGRDVRPLADEIAEWGVDVLAVRNGHLTTYNGEAYKDALAEVLPDLQPAVVCAAHSTQGMEFAPGLAVRLGAACVTAVTDVAAEADGGLCFQRYGFHGKIVERVRPLTPVTVVTVQPGAFQALSEAAETAGRVDVRPLSIPAPRSRNLELKPTRETGTDIAQAEVIAAAGRGIGKKENLALVERLAALFPRSAVGGSRPVCDSGWLEYHRQVGLTGATVAPRLYIACGVSGAPQHTVGMQGAGFIVAISSDPQAAIFNIADVCVVEDLASFIPLLLEEYEAGRSVAPAAP